jgi:alginate O-acetyltransferase complex protein AlgI
VRWWWFNVFLVFVVSGIWHGAGWNFVLWGALHGGYLIVNRLGRNRLQAWPRLSWAVTMLFVALAWLPFYETRTGVLAAKFATLVDPTAYGRGQLLAAVQHWDGGSRLVLGAFLLLAAGCLLAEGFSLRRDGEAYAWLRRPWVLVMLVVLTVLVAPGVNNGFVYFAF